MNVTVYWLQCDERAVLGGTTVCSPLKIPLMLEHGLPAYTANPGRYGPDVQQHTVVHGPLEIPPHAASAAEVCSRRRMAILLSPRPGPCRPFPRASLRPLFANAPARNSSFYVGGAGG